MRRGKARRALIFATAIHPGSPIPECATSRQCRLSVFMVIAVLSASSMPTALAASCRTPTGFATEGDGRAAVEPPHRGRCSLAAGEV